MDDALAMGRLHGPAQDLHQLGRRSGVLRGAARVLREHTGGSVLVIGSGATLPQMIRELNGVDIVAAAQGESDILYVLSVPSFGRAHLVRIRL